MGGVSIITNNAKPSNPTHPDCDRMKSTTNCTFTEANAPKGGGKVNYEVLAVQARQSVRGTGESRAPGQSRHSMSTGSESAA